jgi:hypothetical protein
MIADQFVYGFLDVIRLMRYCSGEVKNVSVLVAIDLVSFPIGNPP